MRDMADSCATISVALCYTFRSDLQGAGNAEERFSHDETRGSRLAHRAAGDGAAGLAGPALDAAHRLGAAPGPQPDLARAAIRVRRGLTDGAERAVEGAARGGLHRSRRGRRLCAHAARQGAGGACDAAAPVRGEVERALAKQTRWSFSLSPQGCSDRGEGWGEGRLLRAQPMENPPHPPRKSAATSPRTRQGNRIWPKFRIYRQKTRETFAIRFYFVHYPIPSPASFQRHMRLPCRTRGEVKRLRRRHRQVGAVGAHDFHPAAG